MVCCCHDKQSQKNNDFANLLISGTFTSNIVFAGGKISVLLVTEVLEVKRIYEF